jgi:hypothetical protein
MSKIPSRALQVHWPAVLFLVWSIAGCAAFVAQWTIDLEALARSDPFQAQVFAQMPVWAWSAYGVAVISGLLSAILLMLGRKGAARLAAVEIAAVIAQFSYSMLMTDLLAVRGIGAAVFPAVILAIAVVQFVYARKRERSLA